MFFSRLSCSLIVQSHPWPWVQTSAVCMLSVRIMSFTGPLSLQNPGNIKHFEKPSLDTCCRFPDIVQRNLLMIQIYDDCIIFQSYNKGFLHYSVIRVKLAVPCFSPQLLLSSTGWRACLIRGVPGLRSSERWWCPLFHCSRGPTHYCQSARVFLDLSPLWLATVFNQVHRIPDSSCPWTSSDWGGFAG